jgi:hypothetical protein
MRLGATTGSPKLERRGLYAETRIGVNWLTCKTTIGAANMVLMIQPFITFAAMVKRGGELCHHEKRKLSAKGTFPKVVED